MRGELPDFREWSAAAIWLLRGVIDAADERIWSLVLSNESSLSTYFARLGLRLIVDESEGLAYLRQLSEQEATDGYADLPKLFRQTRFGYPQTVLCVLLRDELRRFEEEEVHDDRCVIAEATLLDEWRVFMPQDLDDVKALKDLTVALRKFEQLGIVRRFSEEPPSWEIRRILKARLPISELERLLAQFSSVVDERASRPVQGG
jgi:uncharacterized protein DUF4194